LPLCNTQQGSSPPRGEARVFARRERRLKPCSYKGEGEVDGIARWAYSSMSMNGKELAEQVAKLSPKEREAFIAELLTHEDIAEELGDILLVSERRDEPSIPFAEVVDRLKRDKRV